MLERIVCFLSNLDSNVLASIFAGVIAVVLFCLRRSADKKEQEKYFAQFFIPKYLDEVFVVYEYCRCGNKFLRSYEIELKEAKKQMRNKHGDHGTEKWESEGRKKFHGLSKCRERPGMENFLSYRLCNVLNRVGLEVFTGKLPMAQTLNLAGQAILEDWDKSKALVENMRGGEGKYKENLHKRNFFQWFAGVCCMWMVANSDNKDNNKIFIGQLLFHSEGHAGYSEYIKNPKKLIRENRDVRKSILKKDKRLLSFRVWWYLMRLEFKFKKSMK